MTKRHALTDRQWDAIKDLLPGKAGDVGVTANDNRLFVDAVLYRYRTGIPWRDLPERFGDFFSFFSRSHALRGNAVCDAPASRIERYG